MFLYVANRFNPTPSVTLLPDLPVRPDRVLVPYIDAPLMVLPRTPDGLRALRSGRHWRKRSWAERKFADEHGELAFEVVRDVPGVQRWMPKVHALFTRRWAGRHTGSEWATERGFEPFVEALSVLAPEGEASLAILHRADDEELLAFGYNLESDRVLHFYQHAASDDARYRSASLGQSFMVRLLRDTIETGRFDAFDFMIGTQPYKLEWATRVQRTWRIVSREDHAGPLAFRSAVLRARATEAVRASPLAYATVKRVLDAKAGR